MSKFIEFGIFISVLITMTVLIRVGGYYAVRKALRKRGENDEKS